MELNFDNRIISSYDEVIALLIELCNNDEFPLWRGQNGYCTSVKV